MFCEVGVVLDVEGRERQFADEAAGRDPGVVRWSGSTAQLGVRLDLAPAGGDALVVRRTTSAALILDFSLGSPAFFGPGFY